MSIVPARGVVISEPTQARQLIGYDEDTRQRDERVSPYRSIDSSQQQDNSTNGRIIAPNSLSTSYDALGNRSTSHLGGDSVDATAMKTSGPTDKRPVVTAAIRDHALDEGRLFPVAGGTPALPAAVKVYGRTTAQRNIPPNEVDDVALHSDAGASGAVGANHVKWGAARQEWFPVMSGVGRVLPGGAAPGGDYPVIVRNENIWGISAGKVVAGRFPGSRIGSQAIHYDQMHNDLQNGPMGYTSMRFIGTWWGGNSTYAASNNHAHASLYLNQMPLDVQGAVLDLRKRVRENGSLEDIKQLLLVLCSMSVDEEHETADERLDRIKTSTRAQQEWGERWWDDRGDGERYYPPEGHYLDPPEDWPRGSQAEQERAHRWRSRAIGMSRSMGSLRVRAQAVHGHPTIERKE